jgi:pimeloyl-ACP methyl ester carboxylesterase
MSIMDSSSSGGSEWSAIYQWSAIYHGKERPMSQLVFLHGPGAGACADAFHHQLEHFAGSVAPTLPGHLEGSRCPDVTRYMEWVRGWLWAQDLKHDLVLIGYTLGASIALQYGLDYPDEVKGLVVMTVAARPKTRPAGTYEMRLRAAEDPKAYEEWLAYQRHAMQFVKPDLREQLLERHRQVGPLSQYHDLKTIDAFDVRDRLATLKPKLLLLRGVDDPGNPPEYEKEIHDAVPGSRYVKLSGAGHFPPTEIPDEVNALIEEFVATL